MCGIDAFPSFLMGLNLQSVMPHLNADMLEFSLQLMNNVFFRFC